MIDKTTTISKVLQEVKDGMRIMIGGFLAVGVAEKLVDGLLDAGVKDLEMVCVCTDYPDRGVGKLIAAKRVRKVYTSHAGTNPETGKQYNEGSLEIEFNPQGTLAERIRAAGAGLGGVLTPTGIGTQVAEGKQVLVINEKEYLLEEPLSADIALVKAYRADTSGNLQYRKSAANLNPLIATAASLVIAEAEHIVQVGEIDPDSVDTPGLYIDYVVRGGQDG